jgi:hypothetical protein
MLKLLRFTTTILCFSWLAACGAGLSKETQLRVRMVGSQSQPIGATGTKSPVAQVYLFNNISLAPADGSAAIELYSGEALEKRIVARPQELWSTTDLTAYESVSFSSATVRLDPAVLVINDNNEQSTITLDSGDLVMNEGFSIEKGKETVITIRANWGKTITPEDSETGSEATITAPAFTLFLGETE